MLDIAIDGYIETQKDKSIVMYIHMLIISNNRDVHRFAN